VTIRNLVFSSLLALSTCAGPSFAFAANEAPICDVKNQAVTLEAAVAKEKLTLQKLDAGTTQAFLAQIGISSDEAKKIDSIYAVTVTTEDGENVVLLFAFKDGCYVGAVKMPEAQFKAFLARTQAAK
jgi:hypothetical protein